MKMSKPLSVVSLFDSIKNSQGMEYRDWRHKACVEFGVFLPILEKKTLELVRMILSDERLKSGMSTIRGLKNLPGEYSEKKKDGILAGRFCGSKTIRFRKAGTPHVLNRFTMIQQGKKDRKMMMGRR
jgi:hypothetical protein